MTTLPGAVVALAVLAVSGCLPVVALVGLRWFAVPLFPLLGAVVAAVAATVSLGIGAGMMTWFVVLSSLLAVASVVWWWRRPDDRPWHACGRPTLGPGGRGCSGETLRGRGADAVSRATRGHRLLGILGAVLVTGACAWCLRTLASPTIGFDARAIWLMRAGWFLQPHHRLLVDMSSRGIFLPQTSYPPLTSAAVSVGWSVTGSQSMRLGVVVIALLNTFALAATAFAVIECGRVAAHKLSPGSEEPPGATDGTKSSRRTGNVSLVPNAVGVVVGTLLVLVGFGVAGPFMTNGYADPVWSISAVGAVAYGLQLPGDRSALGAAAVLLGVAGLSKDEGVATAMLVVLLLVVRRVRAASRQEGGARWRPVLAGFCGVVLLASWPATVHVLGLREVTPSGGPGRGSDITRAHQALSGLAPHLHVVLFAFLVAAVGASSLSAVRRAAAIGNDGWAWAALVGGLLVTIGAYVAGNISVPSWVLASQHRVTEFAALCAWLIVAMWAVTGSAVLAVRADGRRADSSYAKTPAPQRDRPPPAVAPTS